MTLEELERAKSFLNWVDKENKRAQRSTTLLRAAVMILRLKVFIYEQKVPKDGHGPVVIIEETRELADALFLKRFAKKWPKVPPSEGLTLLNNAKVTVKPVGPHIVLDHHGI
ncbi:MAG: hypothetical protein G01um10143_70 [Parcubacteria group bacterium Gr01-1014_3]|nr:MAG: hypothetical protein G01um10143_70 [Parcubacteria group bacterium Gr01-1014_3]